MPEYNSMQLDNDAQVLHKALKKAHKRIKFENWEEILDAYFSLVENHFTNKPKEGEK